MHRRTLAAWALWVFLAPVTALAGERVGVVVEGPPEQVGSLRDLLRAEVENRGIVAVPLRGARLSEDEIPAWAEEAERMSVQRVIVLTVVPLENRIVFLMTDRRIPDLQAARAERITATSWDEADVLVPRLAEAVLGRQPVQATATLDRVAETETAAWQTRPGQFLWGLGIPFGVAIRRDGQISYGAAVRLAFEMAQARVDLNLTSQFNAGPERLRYGNFALEAFWLALQKDVSPYLGGGLGYAVMEIGDDIKDLNGGLVFNVRGGVEFFRLQRWRLLLDVGVALPVFRLHRDSPSTRYWIPVFTTTLCFLW